jgi:hypothetical protein
MRDARRLTSAVLVASAVFVLHARHTAAAPDPQDSLVFRPVSGQWQYASTFGTEHIAGCAGLPPATRSAAGPATVSAATNGSSVRIHLSNQELLFIRDGLTPTFRTFPRWFPVRTDTDGIAFGTVEFEIHVESPSSMTGTTRWDNRQGCQAAYPFTLTLVSASEPEAVVPRQGHWTTQPLPAPCADGLAQFTPTLAGLTTITFDPVSSLTFAPPSSPPTHVLRNGPLSWQGPMTTTGIVDGVPRSFVGQVYATFIEPTSALATFVGVATTGACAVGVQMTLTWASPAP